VSSDYSANFLPLLQISSAAVTVPFPNSDRPHSLVQIDVSPLRFEVMLFHFLHLSSLSSTCQASVTDVQADTGSALALVLLGLRSDNEERRQRQEFWMPHRNIPDREYPVCRVEVSTVVIRKRQVV
jgi:hypothetical protein